jgi:hypothetical protein
MAHKQPFGIVDIVLIVVIVGLTAALWWVIWSPGQELRYMDDMKWESRSRMSALRSAEIEFFNAKQRYTDNLDTLMHFIQNEVSQGRRDSLFTRLYISAFSFDSLRQSPLKRLPYEIAVDDTSAIKRYQIMDPDGFGSISSISNPDEHNKASWEQ